MTAIWAVTTRGNFWPAWALLGLGSAVGAHWLRAPDSAARPTRPPGRDARDEPRRRGRGAGCRAAADRARPPRRRPGAPGRARAQPRRWRSRSSAPTRRGAAQLVAEARAGVARGARASCAISPAASTRPSSPTVGSAQRSRRSPIAARSQSTVSVDLDRAPARGGRDRRLLRRRRSARQRGQARRRRHARSTISIARRTTRLEVLVTRRRQRRRRPVRRRPDRPPPARRGARRNARGRRAPRAAHHDPRGAPMRVVIAEDLALLRDGLTRLLRDNGFEVVAAVDDADSLVHAVIAEQAGHRDRRHPPSPELPRRGAAGRARAPPDARRTRRS